MKICPNCNELCSDRSNFCPNCGNSLVDAVEPEAAKEAVAPVEIRDSAESAADPVPAELRSSEEEPVSADAISAADTVPEDSSVNRADAIGSKKTGTLKLVRVSDSMAVTQTANVYIDGEYAGEVEYASEQSFEVPYGRHTLELETSDQKRSICFELSEEQPVKVHRFSIRNPRDVAKSRKKNRHIFSKVFCTLLLLIAALTFFALRNDRIYKRFVNTAEGFGIPVSVLLEETASSASQTSGPAP